MKKQLPFFVHCFMLKMVILLPLTAAQAQISEPHLWNNFVYSSENYEVTDTFRLQTFGNEEADDWYCDQSGGANIQSCPSTDNTGFGGKKELRLPMGAALSLSAIDLKGYTSSQILFSYRVYNLKKGSKLTGDMYRSTGMVQNVIMESTADNTSNSYKEVRVNNAYKLDLFTNTLAANTGYYAVRYVLAQGHIPAYSLFSGNGFWSDSLCWSHLPAMRNRHALIQGSLQVDQPVAVQTAALAPESSLSCFGLGSLQLHALFLHDGFSHFEMSDACQVKNQIHFQKQFSEKGKWYFISFPFDVYADDVDPTFQQGDDNPNLGGNYFYVLQYDGSKRAQTKRATGNWQVVPIQSAGAVLFEKHKGYLIALDEQATTDQLSFSSSKGVWKQGYEREVVLSVGESVSLIGKPDEHEGWQLLGNPFPFPLRCSALSGSNLLNGFIYVYEANGYKAYDLKRHPNLAIPPFSAFFIKATAPGTLHLSGMPIDEATQLLKPAAFSSTSQWEPVTMSPTSTTLIEGKGFTFGYKAPSVFIRNLPEAGQLRLFSYMGQCVWQQSVPAGAFDCTITSLSGPFILQLELSTGAVYHQLVRL